MKQATPKTGLLSSTLDEILTLQLLIAWAGEEAGEPKRLAWWRSSMVDEFGGEDLFQQLLPDTWKWAVLEAARAAAKKADAKLREKASDADQLVSLFHFGFVIDEQLDDRLAELKVQTIDPASALTGLAPMKKDWDAGAFLAWLGDLGSSNYAASPSGRRLRGEQPTDPLVAAKSLAAAHAAKAEAYPAPHYRRGE